MVIIPSLRVEFRVKPPLPAAGTQGLARHEGNTLSCSKSYHRHHFLREDPISTPIAQ